MTKPEATEVPCREGASQALPEAGLQPPLTLLYLEASREKERHLRLEKKNTVVSIVHLPRVKLETGGLGGESVRCRCELACLLVL